MAILKAGKEDIPQLKELVNLAYRGEASKQGWTTEAHLFEGDRIDEAALHKMIDAPAALLYKYEENDQLLGCVYLRKDDDALYLGMLTVSPPLQSKGIGKQLMQVAEAEAIQQGCSKIYMRVIDTRNELINWYNKQGYTHTGKRVPYNSDGLSKPYQPIQFAILEKNLTQ